MPRNLNAERRVRKRQRDRANSRAYRAAHLEAERARVRAYHAAHGRAYRAAHLEAERARGRAYHAAHGEEDRTYNRAYRSAHLERMRDRDREYARAKYAADPENSRARSRAKAAEWRVAHPDYDSVQGRRNYAAHSEKMRESVRIWRAAHPEECRAFHTRYKARKLGNGGRHTADAWRALVAATGSRCAYCGAAGDARTFHVEHRVPIARAGCDCIANVAPSCEPCNLSKGRLTDREYVERRRREGKRVRVAILRRPYCLEHFAREAR